MALKPCLTDWARVSPPATTCQTFFRSYSPARDRKLFTSPAGTTTTTCSISCARSNCLSVCTITGVPLISRNCLGRLPPKRVPLPPATIIATFIYLGFGVADAGHRGGALYCTKRPARALAIAAVLGFFADAAEDHFAGGGLQHAGDGDVSVLSNQAPRVVDDHHRAVVQIGDTLVVLFAFLKDEDAHRFARQNHRLQRVREFVDVQHVDAAKLRYFVEIEIVRDNDGVALFAQFDQFEIDFAHGREIGLNDLNVERVVVLQTIQHVQAAPAALAFRGIRRVGNLLKFAQNELRNDERAGQEARFGNIRDAPVDDDRRVENLQVAARDFVAENPAERGEIEIVALRCADHQANVGHEEDERKCQKGLRLVAQPRLHYY